MIVGPTSFEIEMRRNLIINMENKLGLMRKMLTDNNVDEKEFNKCFNNIVADLSDYMDCSKVKVHIDDNEIITLKDVESNANYSDKFYFAKHLFSKFMKRFEIASNYSQEPDNILIDLAYDLEYCTNVKNIYFTDISSIMGDNLFYRVLKSRFKFFNVIFKEEIRFLTYDFRKFLDIDKLSNHCADIHEDSLIKINQKQGLILYEIGELIYDGKLNKASEEFYKFVHDENLTLPPYRYVKSGKPYTIR